LFAFLQLQSAINFFKRKKLSILGCLVEVSFNYFGKTAGRWKGVRGVGGIRFDVGY
jgi:hypothetical protein